MFETQHGAARRTEPHDVTLQKPPAEPRMLVDVKLSQLASDFLARMEADGSAPSSVRGTKDAMWYVFEFLNCDPPRRELREELPRQWVEWLRTTRAAPRKPHSMPKRLTPASVSSFLTWPPKRSAPRDYRSEQTIGRFLRDIGPFFRSLGLSCELPKRERINLSLPPPLVPAMQDVQRWWAEYLAGSTPTARMGRRRRVVLMQGLIGLTGMRLAECLRARLDDLEGHWLLVRETKTHKPRIIFVNSRALGIAKALRTRWCRQPLFAEESEYFAGWAYAVSTWKKVVRTCKPAPHAPKKPHQALRCVLSTYMHRKDPVAEAAQLGHGQGVVFKHYLDVLRKLPAVLGKLGLPEVVEGFTWPARIEADDRPPARLYEEFRRLVSRRAWQRVDERR